MTFWGRMWLLLACMTLAATIYGAYEGNRTTTTILGMIMTFVFYMVSKKRDAEGETDKEEKKDDPLGILEKEPSWATVKTPDELPVEEGKPSFGPYSGSGNPFGPNE